VRVQLRVALLVALEGGAVAVEAVGVELHDQPPLRPVGVHLVPVELHVDLRARDAMAIAEVEERRLGV
jgi:hypothetical protein